MKRLYVRLLVLVAVVLWITVITIELSDSTIRENLMRSETLRILGVLFGIIEIIDYTKHCLKRTTLGKAINARFCLITVEDNTP